MRGKTTNYAAGGGIGGVVTGSTKVLVQGGTVARPVYGGGINATATVGTETTPTGSTYVELSSYTADDVTTDALVTQYVCGGGQLGDVYGDTHVSIKGGTANQNVFGGGYCNLNTKACGLVHGDTKVEVSGGKVNWNVYGGGYGGTVDGTATISITGGEFSATSRVYRYFIAFDDETCDATSADNMRFCWNVKNYTPNLERLNKYCECLRGEIDCASFAASGDDSVSTFRYIDEAKFFMQKDRWGRDLLVFQIEANAFLWKMVRTLTGTLVNLDKSGAEDDAMKKILEARDRTKAGVTAPPTGLFLYEIKFDGIRRHV